MDGMFSMLGGPAGSGEPSSSRNGTPSKREKKSKKRSAPSTTAPSAEPSDTERVNDGEPPRKKGKGKEEQEVDPMEALEAAGGSQANVDGVVDHADNNPALAEKPMPVVTDDFEQEAEREVQATTGFAAAAAQEGEKMKLVHQVRHQVALPPNYPYIPISTHVPLQPPAKVYPFNLDPFQRVSVSSIERNESVLVSAHTSAGKTVVAEYAIASCLKEKKRVVYTSPIKALSNQKYRELQEEFGDVGLMTGDTTINPTASCLVMTTEILRSMLYRGSEVMREVAWVIFDEIHYMRDKERGVVWEETIILLPHKVRYVFLSATIPNSMQFAEWICKLHDQPCHVVYTDFRPTPLQHYMFPENGDGLYLVVDEKGVFREDNFQKSMGSLQDAHGEDPSSSTSGKGRKGNKTRKGGMAKGGGPSDIEKIVELIIKKNLNPVIIFAFSKRECENLATQMSSKDTNTPEQAAMVEDVFNNAMTMLSDEEKELPQIQQILPLLKRGIGIHHGGLLPILKEVIEILFQEGLIKILFATETFSIGLNMPAKTVVFTAVTKFDGKEFRNLTGGEYVQMSGRAGRRGLDARGIVIMMCDTKLEPEAAKGMVKGQADRLDSAFHLGYNMILNLMRVEGVSPEYMLERCFYQFQNTMSIPMLEETLGELESKKKQLQVPRLEEIQEYYDFRKQVEELQADFREIVTHPSYSLPFMQPGRVISVLDGKRDFGWGVVINYEKRIDPQVRGAPPPTTDGKPQDQYIILVLLMCATGSTVGRVKSGSLPAINPPTESDAGEPVVVPVLLSRVHTISHVRLVMPKDLRPLEQRNKLWKSLKEVKKRFPQGLVSLDPIANMNITDESFQKLVKKISVLEKRISKCDIAFSPELPQIYTAYEGLVSLNEDIKATKKKIDSVHSILQLDELKNRKRVLRRLGFSTSADVIEVKGRVACEISTGDELLLTELIFSGTFNSMEPEHCAALLSCFVWDEKSESKVKLQNDLAAPLRILQETARRIAQVSTECKLTLVPDEYVQKFKVELMEVVYKWCKGASFADILKLTDAFEGSLIRAFRRLQELLRQMGDAAKAIGNTELEDKFKQSGKLLERPNTVVFNPSLYL